MGGNIIRMNPLRCSHPMDGYMDGVVEACWKTPNNSLLFWETIDEIFAIVFFG
jgi:hypothetical protein